MAQHDSTRVSRLPPVHAILVALLLAGPAAAADGRPNLVILITDDGPTREELQYLPRLRKYLFAAGIEFKQFVDTNPICCPARASTLRGQYSQNTGIEHNRPPDGGFYGFHDRGLESETLAVWLQRAGYETALFGKYLNGYGASDAPVGREYVPPGWSGWYAGAAPGIHSGYNFWLNENGAIVEYGEDGPHVTDVLAERAVGFIREHADEPLFLYLAPGAPHSPSVPAHRYKGLFADVQLPQPPNFNEVDRSDKPLWVRRLELLPADDPARLMHFRNRLRSMLSIEDMLVDVLNELQAQGKLDNTYVIFFSDNGWHAGEHGIPSSKGTAYEESLVVPAVMRGPGIEAGGKRRHLVANHDIAPTFLDLAGVEIPAFVDGRSLLPVVASPAVKVGSWRRAVGILHDRGPIGGGPSPSFTGVRTRHQKLVRYVTGEEEFYRLSVDRYEMQSQHANPLFAPRVQQLRAWAEVLTTCAAQACRDAEMHAPR